jgi:N-acetyl-gamma-glutamyl-phosphate reductase
LLRLLVAHPQAEVCAAVSHSEAGQAVGDILPAFRDLLDLTCESFDAASLAERCDVVCIAVPSAKSMVFGAELRKAGAKVIDVGSDFRLKDPAQFKQYYKAEHVAPELLPESVYGLVALNREQLRTANLVAVPGCYPISAITPLRPLVEQPLVDIPIVIDSVSGISGAGKSLSDAFHFPAMNENVKAYGVAVHRHAPEIEQALEHKAIVQFTPHVAPYTRGILSTITLRPAAEIDVAACLACYNDEPFVRVLGEGNLPEVQYVRGTNFCDIGWVMDERTGNLIVVSAIDNLMGGTAGMAVQSMNLMFGLDETTGLMAAGMAP